MTSFCAPALCCPLLALAVALTQGQRPVRHCDHHPRRLLCRLNRVERASNGGGALPLRSQHHVSAQRPLTGGGREVALRGLHGVARALLQVHLPVHRQRPHARPRARHHRVALHHRRPRALQRQPHAAVPVHEVGPQLGPSVRDVQAPSGVAAYTVEPHLCPACALHPHAGLAVVCDAVARQDAQLSLYPHTCPACPAQRVVGCPQLRLAHQQYVRDLALPHRVVPNRRRRLPVQLEPDTPPDQHVVHQRSHAAVRHHHVTGPVPFHSTALHHRLRLVNQ
mmetsp:Transcript_220/g.389  ORF Transcript_220/g.389 Transcript_220/m.389 type:complete len:280 (-) Transcript_220:257-1096(-)